MEKLVYDSPVADTVVLADTVFTSAANDNAFLNPWSLINWDE